MKSTTRLVLTGFLLACPPLHGEPEEIPRAVPVDSGVSDRVTSRSEQFLVRGGESALRGSIAVLADQVRDEFLALIHEPGAKGKIPIHITLIGRLGDPSPPRSVAKSITLGDNGYQIHIHLHIGRGVEVARFENTITAALIYERSLQSLATNEPTDTPLLVQPWLVDGLREANRSRLGTSDRRLYEVLFRSGGLFKLDDLFSTTEASHDQLDAASRAAFHISSGALIMALLEQPDGKEAFRSFLGEVALFAGEMPTLLRKHFPDLNLSENSMAKWRDLQLAAKGTAKLTESLTIAETEATLVDALTLRFRDPDGGMREVPIDQWLELVDLDETERSAAVRMAEDALVRLSYRSFPTYRPLLASYQQALTQIARDTSKPEAIAIQLDELAISRKTILEKSAAARDYLDWFEITRAREISGAFDDYLRLKEQLASQTKSQRRDPVSQTLDRFDAIFHRDTGTRHTWQSAGFPNHLPFPPP